LEGAGLRFPNRTTLYALEAFASASKKAARQAFGIKDELDRSLKKFEFSGTTPHSRSTAL
jgi:hypothetical protein